MEVFFLSSYHLTYLINRDYVLKYRDYIIHFDINIFESKIMENIYFLENKYYF